MRKIIVSMNVTLDGFMAGPLDELDWHFASWTEEMAECLGVQLSEADTILLGRDTYTAMADYWPGRSADITFARDDLAFADMINRYHKIVFSKTLAKPHWHNSRIMRGEIGKEIRELKQQAGKDIIVFGSGKLVASLMVAQLVDEYILWLHPVILGRGKPLFSALHRRLDLRLTKIRRFRSGVILLHYTILYNKPAG